MITLSTLLISVSVVAILLTVAAKFAKVSKNLLISFLQHFTGVLFLFSGFVKAVDPLGTAYKMEQYFGEFESAFSGAPGFAAIFPWMAGFSIGFSVFMIVFEIVLGLMILLGSRPKFSVWAFFFLLIFFTILTGFTYTTGYVPMGVNYFEFAKWGEYVKTNMKVTDCGCFGDFLVLEPKVSFFKDVFLLIPGIIFLFGWRQMHQWFNPTARTVLVTGSLLASLGFCLYNFVYTLPVFDFRPFREGVNIAERKAAEEAAAEAVEITAYKLTNKKTGQVLEIPYEQFMAEYAKYPKTEWEMDQISTEPTLPHTKISEFEIQGPDGTDITDRILGFEDYVFMVVSYKLYPEGSTSQDKTVIDTLITIDTVAVDSFVRTITTKERVEPFKTWTFKPSIIDAYTKKLNPVMDAAQADGVKVFGVTAYTDKGQIDDFRHATQTGFNIHQADDILLKTIIRSNPGVVLMKKGTIIKKWHINQLPPFEKIKATYMK